MFLVILFFLSMFPVISVDMQYTASGNGIPYTTNKALKEKSSISIIIM